MSSFTTKLVLEYFPKTNQWKTRRKLVYFFGKEDSNDRIIVPKGFSSDLASIPWPASMFIPKSGKYNSAAVLHDYLYSIRGAIVELNNPKKRSRKDCDEIFCESMRVLGVHSFKCKIMFRAVRIFGGIPWNKHKSKP